MATMGIPRPSELKALLQFVRERIFPLTSLSLTAPKITVTIAQAKYGIADIKPFLKVLI